MKITLQGKTIDIKVTPYGATRASKEATMYFLNNLSILFGESAELDEIMQERHPERDYYGGQYGTIASSRRASKEIFDQLDAMGLYDKH